MGGASFQPATARKEFELDRVFGPHCSQGVVFHEIQPLMQSVLDGYNVALLAYGQSGSGKTHTMVRKEERDIDREEMQRGEGEVEGEGEGKGGVI